MELIKALNLLIILLITGMIGLDHGWWDALGVPIVCWCAYDLGADNA